MFISHGYLNAITPPPPQHYVAVSSPVVQIAAYLLAHTGQYMINNGESYWLYMYVTETYTRKLCH